MTDPRLPIGVTHQAVAAVLTQIAKREKQSIDQIAERFLVAGLVAERRRIVAERSARAGVEPMAIVVPDFCSETFLRQIWGDQWEVGWWLASCALPEPT
jgi:predicted proteasome-type protease